jgi:mannose-1-phosphate guanylyltransferase/mannose-6-phosphate isomerase
MLAKGRYLWSAGIFLFTVGKALTAFETHAPQMVFAVQKALNGAKLDLGFTRLDPAAWA